MANPEHVEILKQGVDVWNQWRQSHRLSEVDLLGAMLDRTNLNGANLARANLSSASLVSADLTRANLYGAGLAKTSLNGAFFNEADLRRTDLRWANLSEAYLNGADISGADLSGATLTQSSLVGADLSRTVLSSADFFEAYLKEVNRKEALFNQTNFSRVKITGAIFAANDLSVVIGLESLRHTGPSTIGLDTIYESQGKIPEVFLRGCGVPDAFITYMHSLVNQPVQFYSCFISYSSKDHALAERLHNDLQASGVRCWFAPHDLPIGARIRDAIDESIRKYDKLLLLLSKHSVTSDWVEQEVETAQRRERTQKRVVLFPVQLDNAVAKIEAGWPAYIRNTRNIGDFRKWKQPEHYGSAFERLLRDLKAEAKAS